MVGALVHSWRTATGNFIIFLGREPRRVESDLATSLTFDWLVLERLQTECGQTRCELPICRAVLSSESKKRRIPEDRLGLFDSALTSGLLTLEFIDEERHVGGYIRQRIADLADAAVLIGGGKGVSDLYERLAFRSVPVLPCDIDIGSTCNDGLGASALNRRAFTTPDAFFPCASHCFRDALLSVSLASESGAFRSIADRVVSLFDSEFRCQLERATAPRQVVSKLVRVLFVAANPKDQAQLAIDQEGLGIVEYVLNGVAADRIELNVVRRATPDSLRSMLARFRPNVVHFSGHGHSDGIVLQDDAGQSFYVDKAALRVLLGVFSNDIRVVVLNSCSSSVIAEELAKSIDVAVGMKADVDDDTAIAFSEGFFDGFAHGSSLAEAFELGVANCKLKGVPSPDLPVLFVRHGVDASQVFLSRLDP